MAEQLAGSTTKHSDFYQDVVDFHRKFGIQYDGPPRKLDIALEAFRDKRLLSELCEHFEARTPADRLDALVDLVYIALGTAHLHGWDFSKAWNRVHEANMKKVRVSAAEKSRFGHSTDIVKPAGWTAPDLSDLV